MYLFIYFILFTYLFIIYYYYYFLFIFFINTMDIKELQMDVISDGKKIKK